MGYSIAAKESVDYRATWTIRNVDGSVADITGWTFKATFGANVADPAAFTLASVDDPESEGFFTNSGIAGQLAVRIKGETLQGYPDTTGGFVLIGDLLGTPPGGDRLAVADFSLTIIKGTTE